jgi:hypothetical protein
MLKHGLQSVARVELSTKGVNLPRLAKGHFIILSFSTRFVCIILTFSITKTDKKISYLN